ncbi:MAG: IclR family transcriptional regulator [Sodalis sp. (in: enterobacteria)]|uniref:IclR family transcriptional regulator n=1 Tax=Sodalis sp. (in: enterobacteria) TaxID=1898979 RepID=UPI0039E2A9BE
MELVDLCQPVLAQLANAINYRCNLAIRDERAVVYIARAPAPNTLIGAMNVGSCLPAHGTVVGRILLSELSLEALRALYPEPALERFSPETPHDVESLYALLQRDRLAESVVGESYFESGYSSIAAPVRDHTRDIVAVISTIIPSSFIDPAQSEHLLQAVRRSASTFSTLLHCPASAAGG